MRVGLRLMKNVLISLAKSVLMPLELTAAESAIDAPNQKKKLWIWDDCTDNIKRRNGSYHKNS